MIATDVNVSFSYIYQIVSDRCVINGLMTNIYDIVFIESMRVMRSGFIFYDQSSTLSSG